jgi:hypothetical protein
VGTIQKIRSTAIAAWQIPQSERSGWKMRDKGPILVQLQLLELELTKYIELVNSYVSGLTDEVFYATPGLPELDQSMRLAAQLRAEVKRIHYQME